LEFTFKVAKIDQTLEEYFNDMTNIKDKVCNDILKADFTEENLLRIYKFIKYRKIQLEPTEKDDVFSLFTKSLAKDILDYTGLAKDSKTNVSMLYSFYRFKFDEINSKIEKFKTVVKYKSNNK